MRLHNSQIQHQESSTHEGLFHSARVLPVSPIAVAIAAFLTITLAACADPTPEPTATPPTTTLTAGGLTQTPVPPTAVPTISDREALVALYNATDGPNWKDSTNWISDEPLDEWYGVATDDNGRVSELILWRRGLSGEIPPELGWLFNLQKLYLRSNDLSGEIPPELGRLANLRELHISSNHLSGTIPSELANLSKLEVLDLGLNELSGTIPPELANLTSLVKLDLGWNELTGSFPPELVELQNLTYLDLGGTQVSGCLPISWKGRFLLRRVSGDMVEDGSDLGGLPFCLHTSVPDLPEARDALTALYKAADGPNWKNNLNWLTAHPIGIWHGVTIGEGGRVVELRLPNNGLSGELPNELSNLTDLFVLDLHWNDLHGEIPPELGELANLLHLDLSVNRLSGRIPPELGLLVRLNVLNLHVNDLSGVIPPELSLLVRLNVLNLHLNDLSGELPPDLGKLDLLDTLSLWNNQLTGEIPSEFENLLRLETLDLGGNRLSGEVRPESVPDLSLWLERLAFVGNQRLEYGGKRLNGCVPGSLRDRLELSESALDSLPFCDAGSTDEGLSQAVVDRDALVALFFATGGRNWRESRLWLSSRPIGEWHGLTVDESGRVTRLELPENNLNGQIPPELGMLSNLQTIELWGNELSGKIPPELGSLSNLQALELAANDLSGEIPPDLGLLYNLKELHLYHNQLIGAIPPKIGDLVSLQEIILHGNQLSGEIPNELANLEFLRRLNLDENRLTGVIPPELGSLLHLQAMTLNDNLLEGELPAELGKLRNLRYLRLEGNRLDGCAPGNWQSKFGEHSDLGGLLFCDTASVPQLDPTLLSDRYALVEFYYATRGLFWKEKSNWLSPEPLENWHGVTTDGNGRVTQLNLVANNLNGEFPSEIRYLTNLEMLDLSKNGLKGMVPTGIGHLANLMYLSLEGNRWLIGCIPGTLSTQLNMAQSDLGGLSFCE